MTTRPFSSTRAVLQTPPPSDSTVPIKYVVIVVLDRYNALTSTVPRGRHMFRALAAPG